MLLLQNISQIFLSLPSWTKATVGTVAAAASTVAVLSFRIKKQPKKRSRGDRQSPLKKDFKNGMVYLYQFGRSKVIPSVSPFCLKLETWLRMADIDYENVPIPIYVRSKEGTLPFIELNGKEYGDSSLIIRDLSQLLDKNHLEDQLSDDQEAISRAFEQMVENSAIQSYFYVRYLKKFDEIATENIFGADFVTYSKIPGCRSSFQNQVKKDLQGHGIGKHSEEEIVGIGINDIKAVSKYLGDKQFFFGDQPSKIDATLFGFLAQLLYIPIDVPHRQFIESQCQNLVEYCDRIKRIYWPDWDEICETLALNTNYKN